MTIGKSSDDVRSNMTEENYSPADSERSQYEMKNEYNQIYNKTPDIYISVDANTNKITDVNRAFEDVLGYDKFDFDHQEDFFNIILETEHKELKEILNKMSDCEEVDLDLALYKKDRSILKVTSKVLLKVNDQSQTEYQFICQNYVSKEKLESDHQKQLQSELLFSENKKLYESILDATTDGWWDWHLEEDHIYMSPKFKAYFGYENQEIPNTLEGWKSIVHEDDLSEIISATESHIADGTPYENIVRYKCKNGEIKWIFCRGKAIVDDDGKKRRMVGTHTDLTRLKKVEKQLEYLAHYDEVTMLPNPRYFKEELTRATDRCDRSNITLALLYIDIDDFKKINDSLGHDIGDKLLFTIAQILHRKSRDVDFFARVGGDEFAIIIENCPSLIKLNHIIRRIIDTFEKPILLGKNELKITVSIGAAVYPKSGKDITTLLKYADLAMYQAKKSGKNTYQFFSEEVNNKHNRQVQIESQLQSAILNQELSLVFQPLVSCQDKSIHGFEALLRWKNPEFGVVPPAEFIPISEETSLIFPISAWVFEEALKQYLTWGNPSLSLSINISVLQLTSQDIESQIEDLLNKYDISPDKLILEITESKLMQNLEQAANTLEALSDLGIKIAIDDFGTGYSSLSYLKHLPFSTLKIDRSFIQDINKNPDDEAIVESIVKMGRIMKLDVVAEGVETEQQFNFLKSIGCEYIQGYYISKPMEPKSVIDYIDV
ncbi:EAL domain-containing protein [Francisellaceae bacterium]|nr:EAL domain-containing protein [Francisellaceae bacterium]